MSVGNAIVRMERAEFDFNLTTVPLPIVDGTLAANRRERIVASSRERCAAPREEAVEALLRAGYAACQKVSLEQNHAARGIRVAVPLPGEKALSELGEEPPALAVSTPGRGGEHHKYLQQLIKRWAEARGFAVTIEKTILDGLGSVDVALEKGSRSIACEISVTTNAEHEIGNVQKCFAAGFEAVILISSEKKLLTDARHALVSTLSTAQYRQVKFLAPEEAFSFIESLEAKVSKELATVDAGELMTARKSKTPAD